MGNCDPPPSGLGAYAVDASNPLTISHTARTISWIARGISITVTTAAQGSTAPTNPSAPPVM
jgi:hypothetical protein